MLVIGQSIHSFPLGKARDGVSPLNCKFQTFMIMETNKKESIWSTVLRVVITILTAIATSLGVQSCM